MIDIWYMLVFGVIGYVFKKLDYPLAPLVLALVLGDLAENALRQSLIMSQGSLAILVRRARSPASSAPWRSSSSRCRCITPVLAARARPEAARCRGRARHDAERGRRRARR